MEKLVNIIQSWLSDPNVVKLIEVAIGILIVSIVFKMAARGLSSQVQDGDLR
ncbi:mechanosensitive ion channel family protein, partial [Synechocystis sp. LEGE 06083]|nr:mechanosensitive ion channel family protein [Synechocystis sp. LEGE 06083]